MLLLAGCSLHPEDPLSRIPSIHSRASLPPADADLPELVDGLESHDPAIRFYSSEALFRLTGERLGYRHFAEEEDRQGAVSRWRRWLKEQPQGKVITHGQTSSH